MIIGVLNQKGGVGKTNIAINLAAVFAKAGNRVLVVDGDPQGSALAWSSAREINPIFPVVGMPTPTSLHRDLPQVAKDYDHVVIDGAPRVNELGRAASSGVDLVRKRAADTTQVNPLEPLAKLISDFMARGGTVWACTPCVKSRGYGEADLIDGVIITGASVMHERIKAGAATLSF
jgi:hypothetical protein